MSRSLQLSPNEMTCDEVSPGQFKMRASGRPFGHTERTDFHYGFQSGTNDQGAPGKMVQLG